MISYLGTHYTSSGQSPARTVQSCLGDSSHKTCAELECGGMSACLACSSACLRQCLALCTPNGAGPLALLRAHPQAPAQARITIDSPPWHSWAHRACRLRPYALLIERHRRNTCASANFWCHADPAEACSCSPEFARLKIYFAHHL